MTEAAVLDTLRRISRGESADTLVPLLYYELKRLAHAILRGAPPGSSLQTTDLVHEAYLKLVGDEDPGWNGRAHFFGAAAHAIRQILVDQARHRGRLKRGGGQRPSPIDEIRIAVEAPGDDLVALHEALERLASLDPRKGEVVNLRYFGGLTTEQTADLLGVSVNTVERDWRYARTWLFDALSSSKGNGEDG